MRRWSLTQAYQSNNEITKEIRQRKQKSIAVASRTGNDTIGNSGVWDLRRGHINRLLNQSKLVLKFDIGLDY